MSLSASGFFEGIFLDFSATKAFVLLVAFVVTQRLAELLIAKRNTDRLFARGAFEVGASHYRLIVGVHVFFFLSLTCEFFLGTRSASKWWIAFLTVFVLAQAARVWIIRSMKGRWTTRIIILPGGSLTATGLFRIVSHPNYWIVAIEIFSLPMIFDLDMTAILASLLNAFVLLKFRIPAENQALAPYRATTAVR